MKTIHAVALAAGLALVGCGKGSGKGGGGAGGSGTAGSAAGARPAGGGDWLAQLPKVAAGAPTVAPTGAPPQLLILVDDNGALYLAAAPKTWDGLAQDPRPGARRVDAEAASKVVAEARALEMPGELVIDELGRPSDLDLDPTTVPGALQDDPPPPEPEDEDEESGGTGTAMALDEGKMGKKDADRVEGQYRMRKGPSDAELAADQAAAERVRKGGPLGGYGFGGGFGGMKVDPDADRLPIRQPWIIGKIDDQLPPERRDRYSVLLASARAKVSALRPVLDEAALLAVVSGGAVRLLRLQFRRVRDQTQIPDDEAHWVEVRIWPIGLDVEAVPEKAVSVPWTTGALDPAAVAAAYDAALATRGLDKDYPVDVLVSPDTDVQHLVDVVVALDAAGAHVIGLGAVPKPGDPEALRRGHRTPIAALGSLVATGDLDRKAIQSGLRAQLGAIEDCYTQALATTPDAAGTVTVAFVIDGKGVPRNIRATGVTPEVATCVAAQVGKARFQAPASGKVQVSAPFTMTN